MWRRLRAVLPERRGVLILDGTSFPKQGPASVGVARQYQEHKSELGLDHFEGRSYPGWCHHVVLTGVAHA